MRNFRIEILLSCIMTVVLGLLFSIVVPSFFKVPEMPESGLSDEPCTLDEAIAGCEYVIAKNKEYLDLLLESVEMEAQSMEVVMETKPLVDSKSSNSTIESEEPEHFIPDISLITEPETESESEIESGPETEVPEETIVETSSEIETTTSYIYQPVDSMMSPDLQAWVYAYCKEQGVDPFIVMAICERESCCTANIYGDSGRAYGIMQVQVRWVQDKISNHGYTNEMMLMAQPNIVIGVEILKDHINTGNGMWWAVMAYNGGPQDAGSPATQEYASWVFARAEELRGCPL